VYTRGGVQDKGYEETPGEGVLLCGPSEDPFFRTCGVDQNGRYFVYLCKAWYEVAPPNNQISLIVHEAAHHAGPTDVTYDREQMKRNSQADQLNNAANYQWFAQDIAQSVQLADPRVVCTDLDGGCGYYRDQGYCANNDHIRKHCRKTCGICVAGPAPRPAPPPPAPAPPPSTASCADLDGGCAYYREQGYCANNDHIRKHCQKTCGLCSCADKDGACAYYKSQGYCETDHIKENCAKTCGVC